MPKARAFLLLTCTLILALGPALALAQGPDQTFTWPETGLSVGYPAGWAAIPMDAQTVLLSSDPNLDPTAQDVPPTQAVMILALDKATAAALGEPADILGLFVTEFGGVLTETTEVTFGGLSGLRTSFDSRADGVSLDAVVLPGSTFTYILVGITPPDQWDSFSATFEAMLGSIAVSAPASTAAAADVLVNGVRITVDQSIRGSWNEIDAVELIGTDVGGFEVAQWASQAEATSQYGDDAWSAAQATGEPNTLECTDATTAWASASNTGLDTLTLYYDVPVKASQINIHQNLNPGSIIHVELLPVDGSASIVVFDGIDAVTTCPAVLSLEVAPQTEAPHVEVPVSGVRVTLDQTIGGGWNEIDAVELIGVDTNGVALRQWASSAEATSSYGEEVWSPIQATGEPDTPECGDFQTAWASETSLGQDSLTLYYDTPVIPDQVDIYQNANPGSIIRVEVLPADGSAPIVVFDGIDRTTLCPGVFSVAINAEPAPVTSAGPITEVRITLDQSRTSNWNEIDAVELIGLDASGASLRQWAAEATATSQYGDDAWAASQATGAPDTLECGDATTAWASLYSDGRDVLTLYFSTPVTVQQVDVYQNYNPGSIVQVELVPVTGEPVVIFEGRDPTQDCPGVLSLPVEG